MRPVRLPVSYTHLVLRLAAEVHHHSGADDVPDFLSLIGNMDDGVPGGDGAVLPVDILVAVFVAGDDHLGAEGHFVFAGAHHSFAIGNGRDRISVVVAEMCIRDRLRKSTICKEKSVLVGMDQDADVIFLFSDLEGRKERRRNPYEDIYRNCIYR